MFNKKKDYIKKKYKDVPPINIGDVNRILQQYKNDEDKFRMFTSILEIQKQHSIRTHESNTEEILRKNVQRLIELYGDVDINQDALNNIYKNVDENQDIQTQIEKIEYGNIFQGDMNSQMISIQRQIERYDHYLNVIQTKLSKNIFTNYSSYLQALTHIDQIGNISQELLLKVRSSRENMQKTQQIVLKQSKQILEKRQQILNIQKLIEILKKIKNQYALPYERFILSMQNGYIDASFYLPTITNAEIIDGLQFIPKNYKEDRIEYVRQITCKGIIDQFINYDEKIYKIHYESYLYMEKHDIVQPYETIVHLLILRAFEAKLQIVFDQISQILSIDFYFDNLTDSLNQISKDQLTEFYRELCCQTIHFFMNLHLIIRFHLEYFQNSSIIEIRKLIYEKVFDRICDFINQTTSWPRMNKEDMICFFGMLTILISKCEVFGGQNLQKYKIFIEDKFNTYLESRGNDKQIKEQLINEDCKKCMKITLNQTQIILQIANKSTKFHVFEYNDPFPDTLNIFKSIEYKKIIDLIMGTTVSFKKQTNTSSLIYQGKERTLLLTQTVNQIYIIIQQQLFYIKFFKQHREKLVEELIFLINYYIYTLSIPNILDEHKRYIFDDTLNFNYDQKQEPDQYTQQFEHNSQVILYRERYGDLIRYLKKIHIPEDLKVKKTQQFDLMDRIVYIESIIFIINEFDSIKEVFQQFKPFYSELNSMISQLQEIVIRDCITLEPYAQLVQCKYELKQNDKEDQQRIQLIDKIISTNEIKLQGLSQQQLKEVQKFYYDELIYLFAVVYSRIKKVNNVGREVMLNDYHKVSKTFNVENSLYESYIRVLNQTSAENIIEYMNNHLKIFPYKMLMGLFNAQGLQNCKKQQRKDQLFKVFQNYQE
ncbi:unnamed protein product [Paramecium sonneborni]|uniref:Syndetin C-terminal domain-containing protein n=1 Tax=Paramecium sonneborni TaxID=65129 RepID=A0A8S1MQP9_9CILI|nr:unnamed protein product [Paramecium sonneborni]